MSAHNFVLVHGAWHGGWCWHETAAILRARGHQVTTPTQTGLGERKHLMSRDLSLDVFIEDIVNHIMSEDLRDIVLVGHSFGGNAISGTADRIAKRIARLVYLDALILEADESPFSRIPEDVMAERRRNAEDFDGGMSLPPPPASSFGVFEPEQVLLLERQLTPHPFSTYASPLNISSAPGNSIPASYIFCTDPIYQPLQSSRERVEQYGWRIDKIATGHDAMISAPVELADLLETLAAL